MFDAFVCFEEFSNFFPRMFFLEFFNMVKELLKFLVVCVNSVGFESVFGDEFFVVLFFLFLCIDDARDAFVVLFLW